MTYPKNLKYTKDHEWVALNGNIATVGITGFAIEQLGDIVYLDLPKVDDNFGEGESIGTIESTKTVSDIFTPLTGTITEVNDHVRDNPDSLAEDPYNKGWLVKIKADKTDLSTLMSASDYEKYLAEH